MAHTGANEQCGDVTHHWGCAARFRAIAGERSDLLLCVRRSCVPFTGVNKHLLSVPTLIHDLERLTIGCHNFDFEFVEFAISRSFRR